MPGYNRAPVSAELTIEPSPNGREPPEAQIAAAMRAAGETGLGRESGPDSTLLAGERDEVLAALTRVIEASLDAGAHLVSVRVEAEGDASRF
jgi:uncharacterized protein YqgV (UPF0045/DUF77 family)